MKLSRLSLLAGLLVTLVFPAVARANVQYLKITIKKAMVWPTKEDGKCWDPCLGKRFALPQRDLDHTQYAKYFENAEFRKACTGKWAPDPLVEIQIGKYGKFTTNKLDNTCTPEWNLSHTFRVAPGDNFVVTVYDNDGAAGIQAKRDLMGRYEAGSVPKQLMDGGELVLKRFGQVEALILTAEKVQAPPTTGDVCGGIYEVRIAEVAVKTTKADGKKWDPGFGKFTNPDLVVRVQVGNDKVETPKKGDSFDAKFDNVTKEVPVSKGTAVRVQVVDIEPRSKEEEIGQTAFPDICEIISKAKDGIYTFENFGQVIRVVVIFRKIR